MSGLNSGFGISQKQDPAGAFASTAANNGLSIDPVTNKVILGQSEGQAGSPAKLLGVQEVPLNGLLFEFSVGLGGANGSHMQWFDTGNGVVSLLTANNPQSRQITLNEFGLQLQQGGDSNMFTTDVLGVLQFQTSNGTGTLSTKMRLLQNGTLQLIVPTVPLVHVDINPGGIAFSNASGLPQSIVLSASGFLQILNNAASPTFQLTQVGALTITGGLTVGLDTTLIHTTATLSNSAGALAATLTNSPVVGNPTKWITIDDNGTPRRIPTW